MEDTGGPCRANKIIKTEQFTPTQSGTVHGKSIFSGDWAGREHSREEDDGEYWQRLQRTLTNASVRFGLRIPESRVWDSQKNSRHGD